MNSILFLTNKLVKSSEMFETLRLDDYRLQFFIIQCPPLNRNTLGQHNSENNNQMVQWYFVSRYNGTIS